MDTLIIPVDLIVSHCWVCAVIYMQERRIQVCDSDSRGGGTVYLDSLFRYLKDEYQAKN